MIRVIEPDKYGMCIECGSTVGVGTIQMGLTSVELCDKHMDALRHAIFSYQTGFNITKEENNEQETATNP